MPKTQPHKPEARRAVLLMSAMVISIITNTALFSLPQINTLEWRMADYWIKQNLRTKPQNQAVVIGIDQAFLKRDGMQWPIPKSIYADLLFYLEEMGAKSIGIDVLFSHRTNTCGDEDSIFYQLLETLSHVNLIYSIRGLGGSHKPVVPGAYAFGKGQFPALRFNNAIFPYAKIMASRPGLGNHMLGEPKADGITRRLPLFLESGGYLFPSISLVNVQNLLQPDTLYYDASANHLVLNKNKIALDREGHILLDFAFQIPFITLNEVYDRINDYFKTNDGSWGKKQFNGKMVFIGASDPLLGDNTFSPLSGQNIHNHYQTPKVLLHAMAAVNLAQNSVKQRLSRGFTALLSLALCLLLFISLYKLPGIVAYFIGILWICGSFLLGAHLYRTGYVLPIIETWGVLVLCLSSGSLILFFEKDRDRKFLLESWKTYLSKDLIDYMIKNQVRPTLGGEEGERTAFFTDIQSFSVFSEDLGSPTKLVELLNEYLSAMTDILMQEGGTLDKYEGDAIIAFFGAPVHHPDHARRALRTALRMQIKLSELCSYWSKTSGKWPESVWHMKMRIGINTGPIVTGNMGTSKRMNYTMMGDAVNLASRLESAAKQYGIYICISEDSLKAANCDNSFITREIDSVRVVGRKRPTRIYELMGWFKDATDSQNELKRLFNKGLDYYKNQDWEKALVYFEKSLAYEPNQISKENFVTTNPSMVYIQRCQSFINDPTVFDGKTWDGVFNVKDK